MQPHEALEPTHESPTYEHRRYDGIRFPVVVVDGGGQRWSRLLYLVIVELDDCWVHPNWGQEPLHDMAHAAGGAAEDDDRILRYQPSDPALRRFFHVNGQGSLS